MIQYAHLYDRIACQNLHRFRDYFNQALCCTAAFSNGGVHEFLGNGSTYIRRRSIFWTLFNLCIIHRFKQVDFINTSIFKVFKARTFSKHLEIRSSMGVSEMTTCPRSSPRWGNINDASIIDKGYEQYALVSKLLKMKMCRFNKVWLPISHVMDPTMANK